MIRGTQNKFLVVDHLLQGPETTLWTAADNYRFRTYSFRLEVEKITPIPLLSAALSAITTGRSLVSLITIQKP